MLNASRTRICLSVLLLALVWFVMPETSSSYPGAPPPIPSYADSGCAALAVGVMNEMEYIIFPAGAVNVIYGTTNEGLTGQDSQIWDQHNDEIIGEDEYADQFGFVLTAGDFNCDGLYDLAVGVPGEDTDPDMVLFFGGVNIIYGTPTGLNAVNSQMWAQDTPGVEGIPAFGDRFGAALAAGDFNGDGCDDLAAGVPGDYGLDYSPLDGEVNVLYGSKTGITVSGNQIWTQDSPDIRGGAEENDNFGFALAVGDFDDDDFDDLVIGAHGEDIGSIEDAGCVNVLYGSSNGLSADRNQLWSQDSPGVLDECEELDEFGRAVTSGDFNGDGYDDLGIGVPGESIFSAASAGAVNVLYGSNDGLVSADDQFWHQDTADILGTAEEGDAFGSSLSAGDFNNDHRDDLVVGVPYEDIFSIFHTITDTGVVHVFYGANEGLSPLNNQYFHQNTTDILDGCADGDYFGSSLTSGDFNGDGFSDLGVGVPHERIDTFDAAGAVNVIYGTGNGLATEGNQFWNQNSPGILNTSEAYDYFGWALAAIPPAKRKAYLPIIQRNK